MEKDNAIKLEWIISKDDNSEITEEEQLNILDAIIDALATKGCFAGGNSELIKNN